MKNRLFLPDDVWQHVFSFLGLNDLKNLRQVSKKDKQLVDQLLEVTLKNSDKVIKRIQQIPFYHADLFIDDYYRKTDAYRILVEKYQNKSSKLTSSEIILFALTTEDINKIDTNLLENTIAEFKSKNDFDELFIGDDDKKTQQYFLTYPEKKPDYDLLQNLTIMLLLIKLNNNNFESQEQQVQILDQLHKKFEHRSTQYLNVQNTHIPIFPDYSKLVFAGMNFRNAIFPLKENTTIHYYFISPESFLNEKDFSKALDYLYVQIKDHPQQKKLKHAIAQNIVQAFSYDEHQNFFRFYMPVSREICRRDTLPLIDIALKHSIAGHREHKEAKGLVKKFSLGIFEFKSDFKKTLEDLRRRIDNKNTIKPFMPF